MGRELDDGVLLALIKKNGGGGGSYHLPTASVSVKGGVKVGSGLKMTGEALGVDPDTQPTVVYENGLLQVEEVITEKVHDPNVICQFLEEVGFQVLRCADCLSEEGENRSTSWYVIAKKQVGDIKKK